MSTNSSDAELIAIAGGGIAGLTLALALHKQGFRPTVYEAAPDVRPLGVGINLLPHAMRELTALGLLDDLRRIGVEIEDLVYLTKRGVRIWEEPRGLKAGYRWPQIAIHRGEFQMLLLDKVRELGSPLPDDALEPSELILPSPDATLEEVRSMLRDDGLIPG